MSDGFLQRKIIERIREILLQGASPDQIARGIAVGAALGLFPLFGLATPLCVLVGVRWRLNHVALQLANWLTWPIYAPAIYGFALLGARLTGSAPLQVSMGGIVSAGAHAVLGWCLVAPMAGAMLYYGIRPMVKKLARRAA